MSPERTDFLYPFIEGDERDAGALLADLARSAEGKAEESGRLMTATLGQCSAELDTVAEKMAARFAAGGRLFTFGNGGSATDAAGVARLFHTCPWGVPLPARSLVDDEAVLTALANDVGFELVFSRQIIARSGPDDMALGVSTSGSSTNLLHAFGEAHRRGLLTLGMAGYDGGQMATSGDVDHCLVARSDSVHRIQETQAVLAFELWSRIQGRLGESNDA